MFKIKFATIKQYKGTMEFDNKADFDAEVAAMYLDISIVSFKAYDNVGRMLICHTNEHAVPITKHCPLEKSWIGTKPPADKELEQFGDN